MFYVERTSFWLGVFLIVLVLTPAVDAWEVAGSDRKGEGPAFSWSEPSPAHVAATPTANATPLAVEPAPGGGEMMRLDDSFRHYSVRTAGDGRVVQCK